jgi:hypothetical protein
MKADKRGSEQQEFAEFLWWIPGLHPRKSAFICG